MRHWSSADPVPSVSAWRDTFIALHGASHLAVEDALPWEGRLDWRKSQTYGIALCGGIRENLVRGRRHIQSDPRGTYELLVPITGSAWVEQGPTAGEIQTGFMGLCDMDRPLTFAHESDFVSVAFIFPMQEVERRSPGVVRQPQVLGGANGLGRMIRRAVTTLQEERNHLSEATFDVACEQLIDLVCLAGEGASDSAPTGQRALVEAEIRRYVCRNASDRSLNVAGIARALGWSTRYIQDVLKAANITSRDLIRQERLQLARNRLASTSWAGHSIAQIAYASGFSNHASFSTAFRREFDMTPREARNFTQPAPANRD
ncbi:AraC family transcriptional regulator [Streptomyces sp. NBC_01602]|nr:AraC family transcriptional regulator [Streptomyces sp. NBC_01602]